MVKRYALVGGREDVEKFTFAHDDDGDFVPYSDYLILQTALKEALDGWPDIAYKRRVELRKLTEE